MKKTTALLQRLEQTVTALYAQYAGRHEQKIYARFDRALFSEDFQTFSFYFAQIRQTLEQLTRLESQDVELFAFLSEKLLAQCTALSEAAAQENRSQGKSAVNFKPVLSEREKRMHEFNRLPPRERLTQSYRALLALNEKINQFEDMRDCSDNSADKARYAQLIEITRQRQARCQETIELLEEYLAAFEDAPAK